MQQTLLLVDDEPNVLRALERIFQVEGYHILTATSGLEGLKILAKTPVKVIISDQHMPNMTGSEFLTEVKALYPNTVRIILSSYSEFEAIKYAINGGAIYKFYNKPWDEIVLREAVREAFQINAEQNEKEQQLIRLMNFVKLSGLHVNKSTDYDSVFEEELREALRKEQFVIYYQPIVFAVDGRIKGVEALLYWQHPTKGLLGPNQFISLCVEMGLITSISTWAMRTSSQQLKQWQINYNKDLTLAVNLSADQFNDPGLFGLITDILQNAQILPRSLELEITESLIMYNIESNLVILSKLKKLGVKISLDDFGTGYSALSYLKKFPIDILKIDKTFVNDLTKIRASAEIVITIIALANILGFAVTAEGVEKKDQVDFLKKHQCDYIQGYFYSKPIIAKDFTELLMKDKKSKEEGG